MSKRPQRKKKSAGARLRPFALITVLLMILCGAGAFYGATWSGFYPKIASISGNHVVPSGQIAQSARIAADSNLWLQNMGAAAARVRAIPFIDQVWIHRTLPARVRIVVTERVPYAVAQGGGRLVLVDHDLRVLRDAGPGGTLPVFFIRAAIPQPGGFIADPDARRLRADYDRLLETHVVVRSVQFDKFGDLNAAMPGGVRLLLGDDADLQRKSTLIGPILSQVAATGKRVAAIDLRAPKTPVVVYR